MKQEVTKKRCAIYTRKSTDEGLDQEFNSLDAQREASEHHIKAQMHEGWVLLPEKYDDGGYSGGSMDRPALQRLIRDIENGLIDVVVVYKIDRLSRSMKDFMKLIELFDDHKVSFVSVTQSFNTDNAIGRLMLNILQSFAQFEREQTTERIRDKVAASKRKGMWMGGPPPLGYDVRNRKLEINPDEVEIVQYIFNRFAELNSTTLLLRDITAKGYTTKSWVSRKGILHQGGPFSKNLLYKMLSNPLYIGKVRHKDKIYDGEHDGIIDQRLWDKVRAIIDDRAQRNTPRIPSTEAPALLRGLIFDRDGCAMTPAASKKKDKNKTYRYYVSTQAAKKGYDTCPIKNVAAGMLEGIVTDQVKRLLVRPEWAIRITAKVDDMKERKVMQALSNFEMLWDELFPVEQARILQLLIDRITVHPDKIQIALRPLGLPALLHEIMPDLALKDAPSTDAPVTLEIPVKFKITGGRKYITAPDGRDIVSGKTPRPDSSMIRAVMRGHEFLDTLDQDPTLSAKIMARQGGIDHAFITKTVRMTQLAPDIIEAILQGRQPQTLTLAQLMRPFPDLWHEQRQHFGFGTL